MLGKEYSKLETNAREIVRGHAHVEAMVLWLQYYNTYTTFDTFDPLEGSFDKISQNESCSL